MKKIHNHIWIIAIIISALFMSCEKVIDLDLNSAEPRIVIEGNITSDPGPYQVSITTSGDYYTAEGIMPVSGAEVIVVDNLNHADTLSEVSDGKYLTKNLIGESDRTYSIKVVYKDKEYTGSDYLPTKVYIDSLSFEKMEFGGPGSGNKEKPRFTIYCYFTDPIETIDYYRFNVSVNDSTISGRMNYYSLSSDQLINGKYVKYALWGVEAMTGDTISVRLDCIGFNTYEYFRTLNDALSSGGMGSTPYNPISNLSNKALGYFGAYTADLKRIRVYESN